MFDVDKWLEIFDSIWRHKLRTLLTAFGVFWGIFMLLLLLAAGKGIEKGVVADFGDFAKNSVWIWTEQTQLPYKGLNPGREIRMTLADLNLVRESVPDVKYVATQTYLGDSAVLYNGKQGTFQVRGANPEAIHLSSPTIEGRFLNIPDYVMKRKTAVIGTQVRNMLFGSENPLGRYLSIRGVFFRVVGIFETTGPNSQRDAEVIYIPITTLQQTFNQGYRIWSMAVIAQDHVSAAEVENQVKDLLKRRHRVHPDDQRAIGSWNAGKEFGQIQGLFRGIRLFSWVVGAGTILAGIVGVSNIMLIIVKERTREIGVRKALGATPLSIISLILQESIFITAVSGYTGLVASVGLIEAAGYVMDTFHLQSTYFNNPEINFTAAITATCILVVTGALAGFVPAQTAARINPIEALRSE